MSLEDISKLKTQYDNAVNSINEFKGDKSRTFELEKSRKTLLRKIRDVCGHKDIVELPFIPPRGGVSELAYLEPQKPGRRCCDCGYTEMLWDQELKEGTKEYNLLKEKKVEQVEQILFDSYKKEL